jgi:hypothetical protein
MIIHKKRSRGYRICLAMGIMFMVNILIISDSHAQANERNPEPTVVDMQNTISTQQVEIDQLDRELQAIREDHDYEIRDIRWSIDIKLAVATIIFTVAGFFGIRTYQGIDEKIRKKISSTLDKELYQLDPTMLTIHIREGLDRERRRLEMSGLKNVKYYLDFDKSCRRGVTIVPISQESDEEEFITFLNSYELDPRRAAFILYATGDYRVSEETTMAYENLALANTPTTLVMAVLAVGRGLNPEYPSSS